MKTLTLMTPSTDREFKPDHTAGARIFYTHENGDFAGRMEVTPDMMKILQSKPDEPASTEDTLWAEQWRPARPAWTAGSSSCLG